MAKVESGVSAKVYYYNNNKNACVRKFIVRFAHIHVNLALHFDISHVKLPSLLLNHSNCNKLTIRIEDFTFLVLP